jgi:hypothetical protein
MCLGDKVIVLSSNKESWNKAMLCMSYGTNVFDVEVCLPANTSTDHPYSY